MIIQRNKNGEWLCNEVNSLIPNEFNLYVNYKLERRKILVIQNQHLNITAKKEFIDIFKASNVISLEKEKNYFLQELH